MKRLSWHALIKAVGRSQQRGGGSGIRKRSSEIYLFAVTLKRKFVLARERADDDEMASGNFRPASASIRKLFCRILSPKRDSRGSRRGRGGEVRVMGIGQVVK